MGFWGYISQKSRAILEMELDKLHATVKFAYFEPFASFIVDSMIDFERSFSSDINEK